MFYFLAPENKKRTVDKTDLKDIEQFLIKQAKIRNKDLLNKVNAILPTWSIEGVIRHNTLGHPSKKTTGFKRMMGF